MGLYYSDFEYTPTKFLGNKIGTTPAQYEYKILHDIESLSNPSITDLNKLIIGLNNTEVLDPATLEIIWIPFLVWLGVSLWLLAQYSVQA